LIEFTTAALFLTIVLLSFSCVFESENLSFCGYWQIYGISSIPYLLFVSALLVSVFVTDFEHQIILDEALFIIFLGTFVLTILYSPNVLFSKLLSGLVAALFLLFLHMVTKGKGMGLGDVKLALVGGFILGWPLTLSWMGLSFISGAAIGLGLIFLNKASFGKHIAFGPFLVISFFLTLFFGQLIFNVFGY
jgi:prepilin signal peptidase PulO-like enzyme (type II secretory pathway)